jgi:putative tryptophan/tyrosine transport system substrate-binding protein
MRRREFIAGLGGAAAWPGVARAQQQTMPVIGFIHSASPDAYAPNAAKFAEGLGEAGFFEGRNLAIEYRWAESDYDALPMLAADLARHQLAVIVAGGGSGAAVAAKSAAPTTPIVAIVGDDPIKAGLAASLNKPGGTVSGVTFFTTELMTKRVDLLWQVVPRAQRIAFLIETIIRSTTAATVRNEVLTAGRAHGLQVDVMSAGLGDLDAAFAAMTERRVAALVVGASPLFSSHADQIVALAARYKIPAIYQRRADTVVGGLMSYGTDIPEAWRRGAALVGKILRGAKPADLPFEQSTRFDFVINLKTAKALGLTIPEPLLATADEVIQ